MSLNIDKYQQFADLLTKFRQNQLQKEAEISTIVDNFTEIKQYFLKKVIPVTQEEAISIEKANLQSYRTEMSRQMRLLEMDILFLRGAKQEKTKQVRNQSIQERLDSLISYCEAMKE